MPRFLRLPSHPITKTVKIPAVQTRAYISVHVSSVCIVDDSENWLQFSMHKFSDWSWFTFKLGVVGSQQP